LDKIWNRTFCLKRHIPKQMPKPGATGRAFWIQKTTAQYFPHLIKT
jgi:hypothetical protein